MTILATARIPCMRDVYRTNPYSAPRLAAMTALQRGAKAARYLKHCRRYLAEARDLLNQHRTVEARAKLVLWAAYRREWAHLTNQTAYRASHTLGA